MPVGAASAARADPGCIDGLLPQTQCRRCGFDGCRPYAEAIAVGLAPINRCPPGGDSTIYELATLLGLPALALDPACGVVSHRSVAQIDNDRCIGCTKCIRACPVDAIIGAPKSQHHVLADRCTGCDLCLAPCPTDCITMVAVAADRDEAAMARGRRHHQAVRARRGIETRPSPTAPVTASATASRDPLVALASPTEKARRLALIRDRVAGASR